MNAKARTASRKTLWGLQQKKGQQRTAGAGWSPVRATAENTWFWHAEHGSAWGRGLSNFAERALEGFWHINQGYFLRLAVSFPIRAFQAKAARILGYSPFDTVLGPIGKFG